MATSRAHQRPFLFPGPGFFASRAQKHPILFPATASRVQKCPILHPDCCFSLPRGAKKAGFAPGIRRQGRFGGRQADRRGTAPPQGGETKNKHSESRTFRSSKDCSIYNPSSMSLTDKWEFTSLYHQTLRVLIKCPSCTDANVATPATMATGTMDQKTVGTVRKRRSPVSLLAIV